MPTKTRAAICGVVLSLAMLALVVATACGGTEEPTTTAAPETTAPPTTEAQTTTTVAAPAFEGDAALAAANWEAFFNPTTPAADKLALLENGAAHQADLDAFEASPAAAASVKVTDVQIHGDTADVTFDVLVGGVPMVTAQTGTMVLEDGTWKMSESSLAGMLAALGGDQGGTGTPPTS